MPVGIYVEQDRAGVADQAVGPACDDERTDDAGERVHPEPAKSAGEQQAYDDENRHRGVGEDVDDGGAHIIVAMRGFLAMFVLDEIHGVTFAANVQMRRESVRFWNFLDRLHIAAAIHHCESLPGAIRPRGFNFDGPRSQNLAPIGAEPEARRRAVLEYFEGDAAGSGRDVTRLVMVVAFARPPCPWP